MTDVRHELADVIAKAEALLARLAAVGKNAKPFEQYVVGVDQRLRKPHFCHWCGTRTREDT